MVDMPKGSQAPRRRPSLRGVLMQDIAFGKERVRVWPTGRGRPKTKAQKEAQDKFALVQRMAAYLAPGVLAYIHKAVANSPLLPRDVVTMQLYNRWMAFDLEDGRTLWPMTARNDVSEALDVLTKAIGDYLVRTPSGWAGASTLPSPPTRLKQVTATLNVNRVGIGGFFARVPFDVVIGDPKEWWLPGPVYAFKPDVPGFYAVELHYRKTVGSCDGVWIYNQDATVILASGPTVNTFRSACVNAMLYLDGQTAITSGGWNRSAGTIEGTGAQPAYFRITGPF